MPSCVACKNNSKSTKGKGISFFRFPSDTERRDAWVREIGLKDWSPSHFSRICSEHFEECCYEKSVPDMRQRTQLKKFSIPTIFDSALELKRSKRKKKRKKKNVVSDHNPEETSNSQTMDAAQSVRTVDNEVKETIENRAVPEVRLIFGVKREIETNEKDADKAMTATKKKLGRKKKDAKHEIGGTAIGEPRGREALEEFRQKCGLDLTTDRISSLRSLTQIPLEHNYFVHESAKLLKIKLTQAQEELQDTKQKLERYKHLLRLERRKKVRTQEKAKKLYTSLNGIKLESNKQKQLLNKFHFLFDMDSSGNKGPKPDDNAIVGTTNQFEEVNLQDLDGNELGVIEVIENVNGDEEEDTGEGGEEIIYQTTTEDVGVEGNITATSLDEPEANGSRKISQNNVSLGTELIRRMSGNMTTGKVSRKGYSDEFQGFATTLRKISPKAYEFVRNHLALGLPDVRTVRKHGGGVAAQTKSKIKTDENKIRGRKRKPKEHVDEQHQMPDPALLVDVESLDHGEVNFQIVDVGDELADDQDTHDLSNEVPHFEIVPQTFEIVSQQFAGTGSQDCIYYTYDPGANQFASITWT